MNSSNHSIQIPTTMESKRTPATRKGKTSAAARGATRRQRAAKDAPRRVTLAPAFVALADEFGMVPERLAERVIAAFAATKPTRILVKAREASAQAVH
jgi:hypothetical protein